MLIRNSDQHDGRTCDFCDFAESFDLRLALVIQGATGRFCEVMWACDEHADGSEIDVEEARKICDNTPDGWADF